MVNYGNKFTFQWKRKSATAVGEVSQPRLISRIRKMRSDYLAYALIDVISVKIRARGRF